MRAEPAFITRPPPAAAPVPWLQPSPAVDGAGIVGTMPEPNAGGAEAGPYAPSWTSSVGVKNTFIHIRDDDGEEEDQPRRFSSTPAGPLEAQVRRPSEPVWVPLPTVPATPGEYTDAPPATAASSTAPVEQGALSEESSDDEGAFGDSLVPPSCGLTVKNTFIHYDLGEQPSAFAKKSVSGPAYFARVGEEFAMAATLDAVKEQAPPVAPAAPSSAGAPAAPASAGPSPTPASAGPPGAVPSVGSAGHAAGTCRPCAHNWRPAGCVKGETCTFCHLCEDGVLKQRKKEKMSRIRAERRAKARGSEEDAEHGDQDDACGSGAVPATSSSAPASAPASEPRGCPPALPRSGSPPSSRGADEACGQPAVGEIAVLYSGADKECVEVRWSVDLRKLRQQHRCGTSRRFTLRLFGRDVPFLFNLVPDTSASAEATFRKADVHAVLQVKCTDPDALSGSARFRVAFAAGSLAPREAAAQHDFVAEPLCALQHRDALWDLAAASGKGATACVVKVFLSPS